ncbi:hypothetical protein B484DRAFT_135726 [Ochromonadaceae sp. CCMP2298]|nr:hypothetical protein B484DRAFT_135726 [Ochromonadaceae sp. CCMP2298]
MNLGFVNNPAVRHVANNLTIFGFGSQEGALVQCIKELVENSIDACKRSNATFNDRQMEIKISISNSENGADSLVAVEVQDEGCGMTDVQNLLKPFNTSKDTATTQGLGHTTGRFGVGLSTCMIYSLLNTVDCPMRILTKCPESAAVTAYNFTMDTQGNPRCIQCQELGARGIMSVSLVRLRMPLRTDRAEPLRRGESRPAPIHCLAPTH